MDDFLKESVWAAIAIVGALKLISYSLDDIQESIRRIRRFVSGLWDGR